MKDIAYLDFIVKNGEDSVFILSRVFHSIHGLMRSKGVEIVVVPFYLNELGKPTLKQHHCAPEGIRAYFKSEDVAIIQDKLTLPPSIVRFITVKPITDVNPQLTHGVVTVKRIRKKSDKSNLKRFIARNPGVDMTGKIKHWEEQRATKNHTHLWLLRESSKVKVPFFINVATSDKYESDHASFQSNNTFGMGTAPLTGFHI